MKISRRKFFLNTGIAALTASLAFPAHNLFGQSLNTEQIFPIPPESGNDALSYLEREHFEPFLNTAFRFTPDTGRAFNLKLIEAQNLSLKANARQGLNGESFSLLFEGSQKSKIPQGTYQVNHALGTFLLLIVPVGLRGNRYEAIINRVNL